MPAVHMSTPRDWTVRAECRSVAPELFFPVGIGDAAQADREVAKAICARCEVAAPCLEYALDTRQEFGIWGGLDEEELKLVRRQRARDRRGGDGLARLSAG